MVIFAGIVNGKRRHWKHGDASDWWSFGGQLEYCLNGKPYILQGMYQPVLKALKEKDMENFPLIEKLIYAKWPNNPPD